MTITLISGQARETADDVCTVIAFKFVEANFLGERASGSCGISEYISG